MLKVIKNQQAHLVNRKVVEHLVHVGLLRPVVPLGADEGEADEDVAVDERLVHVGNNVVDLVGREEKKKLVGPPKISESQLLGALTVASMFAVALAHSCV